MRRLIVLCLIFLSVLSFPGNAGAISIEGADLGQLRIK